MRKIILMAIVALTMLSFGASAGTLLNDDVIFGINEIGTPVIDENSDSTNLRHEKHDNNHTLKTEFIDISDIERLIALMSDENLEIEKPIETYEELEAAWKNKEGSLEFEDESGCLWEYDFDESRVVVAYFPDFETHELYAGIFKYKKDIYEELSSVFEKAYDDAYKRTEEAQMLKYIEIDDFDILYSADSGQKLMHGEIFEWGICTYKLKGEKKTVVYSVLINGHGLKQCYMTDKVGQDNYIQFDNDGLLRILDNGTASINQQIKISVPLHSMKISVSEDMKLKEVMVTSRGQDTPETFTADKFTQTGKIPEGFFIVDKETNENEETEESTEEDSKSEINEDDTTEEDITDKNDDDSEYEDAVPEDNDTQISASEKEDSENILPNPEVQIRKNAQTSGLVLTIGERGALINGEKKENDVPPVIRNSRTMLPARFVGESIGAVVEWDSNNQEVTVRKDNVVIKIYIDSDIAYVNNKEEKLDAPAFIENDRTYIPLRFIAENFGADVIWDGDAGKVFIAEKNIDN